MAFKHEQVTLRTGVRSGVLIVVAVHSTALGVAIGGCRMWTYLAWQDAVADAMALSEAMTLKCAAAELDYGGGKAVIALPPGLELTAALRRDVLHDLGDLVELHAGRYLTGEDVGTSAEDMWTVRERTASVVCLPRARGGSGEPSEPTAVGVFAAVEATCRRVFGTADLHGRRFTVIGMGQVGARLARRLVDRGAVLVVSDIDEGKRALAQELGATWVSPAEAATVDTDVLVPAALGRGLTPELVARLSCAAVVGPANNQLSEPAVADLLAARGIVWAPDFIVNAGGAVHGAVVDLGGGTVAEALTQAALIGPRLEGIYEQAQASGVTPYRAALDLAEHRIATALGRPA